MVMLGAQTALTAPPKPKGACDPNVKPDDSLHAYSQSGGICDGAIRDPRSTDQVAFRSFTMAGLDYSPTEKSPLLVRWGGEAECSSSARLEGHDIDAEHAYRADGVLAKDVELSWSVKKLAALNIERHQLGVLTYCEADLFGTKRRIYVPADVRQKVQPSGKKYELVAMFGGAITQVSITLSLKPSDKSQPWPKVVPQGQVVSLQGSLQGKIARISFDRPAQAGVYHLLVEGKVPGSKDRAKGEMFFYEPVQASPVVPAVAQ
jgi:hypothetical protein